MFITIVLPLCSAAVTHTDFCSQNMYIAMMCHLSISLYDSSICNSSSCCSRVAVAGAGQQLL